MKIFMSRLFRYAVMGLLGLVLSVSSVVSQAKGEVYEFQIPAFDAPAPDRPSATYVGKLTFSNGAQIDAYSMTLVSGGTSSGWMTTDAEDRSVDVPFDAEMAKKLDAYAQPSGWILVPKGWTLYEAGLGANGSVGLLFAPDAKGRHYLTFYDTSSCVGCAYSSASLFFDRARSLAKSNEFLFYTRANVALKTTMLRPTHAAYSYRFKQGDPIHGLAIFDPENQGTMYRNLSVRLPASQKSVASAILNWYVPKK